MITIYREKFVLQIYYPVVLYVNGNVFIQADCRLRLAKRAFGLIIFGVGIGIVIT